MGTIIGRKVIGLAQKVIVDDGLRWTIDELLDWLNGGQRQIVLLRPDASSLTQAVQLLAGTKQSIPVGSLRLLSVVRNNGADNNTPGRSITYTERTILDQQRPDWHDKTKYANDVVKNYTYDERDPRTFYVWPPQPDAGRGYVDILTSISPADVTLKDVNMANGTPGTTDSVITLDDIYEQALIDWIIFRAFSKEATYAGGGGKSADALQRFYTALGIKTQSDRSAAVRQNAPPQVNPNAASTAGFLSGG